VVEEGGTADTQGRHLYSRLQSLRCGWTVILFFHLQSSVMSVLVNRWFVGSIWVSCWHVSPGVFVFASQLGYSFSSSCEPPF